jgi:precorrin-2 dehydrogenase/sirohydrochlorin ferrochelatase
MKYYPVMLDIRGRRCLVVGGGKVATRKVTGLLACGARVSVVSPALSDRLLALARRGRISWRQRSYEASDLQSVFLVIGATDDEGLNRRISEDAQRLDRLCNIADRPKACNFILPSIVHRGDLIVTVSTSGSSPAFAKSERRRLEGQYGNEYDLFLKLMGAVRRKLLAEAHAPEAHKPLFEHLIAADLASLIREGDTEAVDKVLAGVLGEGYTWSALMADQD